MGAEDDIESPGHRKDNSTDEGIERDDRGIVFNRWLSLFDEVSQITRFDWGKLWEMKIYEFFTYASYSRWKAKQQAESIKRWERQHVR